MPIQFITGFFIYRDAKKLQQKGLAISPGDVVTILLSVQFLVGIFSFVMFGFFLKTSPVQDFFLNLISLFLGLIGYFIYQRNVQKRVPMVGSSGEMSARFDIAMFILVLALILYFGGLGLYASVLIAAFSGEASVLIPPIIGISVGMIVLILFGKRIVRKVRLHKTMPSMFKG